MWLQVILWLLTATLLVLQALATNGFPRPETYLVEIFWYLSGCLFLLITWIISELNLFDQVLASSCSLLAMLYATTITMGIWLTLILGVVLFPISLLYVVGTAIYYGTPNSSTRKKVLILLFAPVLAPVAIPFFFIAFVCNCIFWAVSGRIE